MNKYCRDCFKFCDVVFKIGDEYILSYRVVLVVCSLYFYVMFINDLMESWYKVVIMKDVDVGVV